MQIKRFIKQVLTIAIGFLVSLLCVCLMVMFVFSQLTSTSSSEIKDNSILELKMKGRVVESIPDALFGLPKGVIDLKVVKQSIYRATKDSRVRAIYLDFSYVDAGLASLEEIREALLAFKQAGKTIIAYGDFYTQMSYYLASVADEIILNPSGYLGFKGFAATIQFYTKLCEHISIKPVIFRIGAYKSAVEPFCLTKMSEEGRKQTEEWLQCTYKQFLTKIGSSRNIAIAALKAHANNLSAVLPNDALHANLITKIGYEADAKKILREKLKLPSFISYSSYNAAQTSVDCSSKIAVVILDGTIVNGANSAGYIGSYDFIKALKTLQEDSSIKAVVLRINSPGGDALASDIMWQAIESLKAVKPVVASMSNVAASGGYYIAAPCHYIFAQPTTITGSIGIFAMLFDPTELRQKIGIYHDVVKTAPSADFLTPRLSFSEQESQLVYKMLQANYDNFLHKVSSGRGIALASVEKLAGGRVYAGSVAQSNGLVDELGGLKAAIGKAAALAKLNQQHSVSYFPRPKTKLEQLLNYTTHSIKMDIFNALAEEYPILIDYQTLSRSNGIQAMLPYRVHIN